jgi:hypothetical protein
VQNYPGLLGDLQDGRCFYCSKPLHKKLEVDHFVPWSRYPSRAGARRLVADGDGSHAGGRRLSSRLCGLVLESGAGTRRTPAVCAPYP